MIRLCGVSRLLPNLLLAVLLIAGQAGAALHAFEHDPGAPQIKVCSTCITAAQLGAASVDSPVARDLEPPSASYSSVTVAACHSRHVLVARQRGPPAPL